MDILSLISLDRKRVWMGEDIFHGYVIINKLG